MQKIFLNLSLALSLFLLQRGRLWVARGVVCLGACVLEILD
jgi:hypothetical protein